MWGRSNRDLPSDWDQRRRTVLARDPRCRSCGVRKSTEVDHRDPRGGHDLGNLRGVCHRCHARKTGAEALQARGYGAMRKRPQEPHPGLLGPASSRGGGDSPSPGQSLQRFGGAHV